MKWTIARLSGSLLKRGGNPHGRRGTWNRRLALEELEPRVVPAKVSWAVDVSGDWNDAGKWVDDQGVHRVPGSGDDVVVNRSGAVTVTLSSGLQSVNSLTVNGNENFSLLGGSLSIAASSEIDGGLTLSGGALDLQGGTLLLRGGAVNDAGSSLSIASGAALEFYTGTYTGTFTGTGAGEVLLAGGTFAGATLNFSAGLCQWIDGTIDGGMGAGLTNQGSLTVAPDSNGDTLTGVLHNHGTIVQTGTGTLDLNDGALSNEADGVYDFQGDGLVNFSTHFGTFTNAGLLKKSGGTGTTVFEPSTFTNSGTLQESSGKFRVSATAFNNVAGTLDVEQGLLLLQGSAVTNNGGTITVAGGAALELYTGTYAGTYTGTGAGEVLLAGGTFAGATLDFPAGLCQWNDGTIDGGTGAGLTNQGSLTVAPDSNGDTLTGVLHNHGTIVQTGTGTLTLGSAVLSNEADGVYDFQNDGPIGNGFGTFANLGVVRKSAGSGTTSLNTRNFDNSGTLQINSGRIDINATVAQVSGTALSGGAWDVLAGSSLNIKSAGLLDTNDATVVLNGSGATFVNFTQGPLTNNGSLTVDAGCTLTVSGDYTQTASGSLTVQLGGPPPGGPLGQVNVTGSATLAGVLDVTYANGYTPHAGDRFQVMSYASHTGTFPPRNGLEIGRSQLLEVVTEPTSVIVNSLIDAADLSVQSITSPATVVPGQNATISYTVNNLADKPTLATTWVDSVYLALGATYHPTDKLIARVRHNGVVQGQSSYSETLSAPMPGVVPGSYHVIVIADSEGFVADTDRTNNILASSDIVSVTMPALTPGVTATGTIDSGQDVYYRVDLPTGPVVHVTANFGAAAGGELLVRYQNVPDQATFDQVAFDPTQARQQVVLNGTQAGTYYILLHGREGSAGGQPFTLTVQELSFQVSSISPNQGGTSGQITVTIQGSQFSPNTTASLVGQDGKQHPASRVLFKDNTTLFATFDLTALAIGSYDVQVQDPAQNGGQPAVDPAAFTVNNGSAGQVTFRLSCSQYTNNNNPGTITIDYVNNGSTDAAAPLMILSADTNVSFELAGSSAPVPGSVQLLGINQSGPAGILPPGYHGTITLSFFAGSLGAHQVTNFTLSTIPSPETPFDWGSVKADLKPPEVPEDAWDAIYQNFSAAVGNTLGQYQQVLDNDATYLSQLGEYTFDVSRLLSFELQKADDFGAISQRYTLGAFGRGWPDPTAIKAVTDSAGNVTVSYSGRVRSFFVQPNGSYQGVPGDAATLTKEADGTYQLRETDGTVTAFNADGTLAYTVDTNGNKITAQYTSGQLTSFVDSTGDTVSFQYNSQGHITQVTDPVGRVTSYIYDSSGQLLQSVTDATGTTSYAYVPGQGAPNSYALATITHPDGSHTNFVYDTQGRLTSQSADGEAELVRYAYDAEGGISVTDAGGGTSTYFVNEFEQVGAFQDPRGHFTHFTYDANHNLVQETGPDGITSTFTADAQGNPTGLVDPLGQRLKATYDPALSRLTNLTDPNGNTTQYGHDANGNLRAITYPDNSQEQFTFDPTGNLTESVDRNGTAIGYKYDKHNLLIEEDFADGTKSMFAYDGHRNLTSATNATGTTAFEFDAADRLTKVTYPSGMYLKFTYNAAGQRSQMVDQTGFTVNYQYDAVGRLAGLTDGTGNLIVKYTYDGAGRLSRKDMGNGTYTVYAYDPAGNLTDIVNSKADKTVISSYHYAYDDQGRPISVTTANGSKTVYGYDATGQLTSVSLPGGRTITYQYDPAGNRVAVTDSGVTTSYTTNNLNEYTQVGSTQFTYYADGSLKTQTDGSGTTRYAYNGLGQLISVVTPKGTTTYLYDALGNRIVSTVSGQETQYLIDPTGIGNVSGEFDGSGSVIAHYSQGVGLTSRIDATAMATFYNFDLTGNTTELTGVGGGVLNSYAYLPFGEQLSATGTTPNPFTFVGGWGVSSDASGLSNMRFRNYAPQLGEFLSNDPLNLVGGSTNLRLYAANNPLSNIDPVGLDPSPSVFVGPSVTLWGVNIRVGFTANVVTGEQFVTLGASYSARSGFSISLFSVSSSSASQGLSANANVSVGQVRASVSYGKKGTNKSTSLQPSFNGRPAVDSGLRVNASAGIQYNWLDWTPPQPKPDPGVDQFLDDTDLNKIASPLEKKMLHRDLSSSQHLVNGDPNSLTGPAGFGTSGYITPTQTLPYTITFANEPTADIPVQQVIVTDQLDPNLDWTTFQVGDFSIGGKTYAVPANTGSYSTRLDLTGTLGIYLDLTAGINLTTGLATWTFTSVDPATGDLPSDIFAGFLPADKTPPQGEASVTYTVRPKASTATATPINAQATVVFDTNKPINTNPVTNAIDAGPPTSTVNPLPAVSHTQSFQVSWSGTDDPGGSGIATFDIFVSTDGGPFAPFLTSTAQLSATFTGAFGHSYGFYSVATDNVGNRQATPTAAQATIALQVGVVARQINDGSAQRSMVNSYTLTFGSVVNLDAGAIEVAQQGGGDVTLSLAASVITVNGVNETQVVITFTGAGIIGGSLADGRYTLTVHHDKVHDAASGVAMSADLVDHFFRLFGDANGDGKVDNYDLAFFRSTYGKKRGDAGYLWWLDFNQDGVVDSTDYAQFKLRYGHRI